MSRLDGGLERTLRGLFPIQHKHNLKIDWLDADELATVIPGIQRDGLHGGTFSPNDGQLSPLKLPVAYQRAAQRLGAEFVFGEKVTGYLVEKGAIHGVRTTKETYHAPIVVVATGADASDDGERLGIDLPVNPDSHEAGITDRKSHV